jgi:uncharacterized repeat protein (TIGR01451 family)
MKKVLFILMIFSLYKNTKGQSNLTPVKDYGNNTQITKIIKAPDGSFYVLMMRFLATDTTMFKNARIFEINIEKCNNQMTALWQKTIDTIVLGDNQKSEMFLADNQLKIVYLDNQLEDDTVLSTIEYRILDFDGNIFYQNNILFHQNKLDLEEFEVDRYSKFIYNSTLNQLFIATEFGSFKIYQDNNVEYFEMLKLQKYSDEYNQSNIYKFNDTTYIFCNTESVGWFGFYEAVDSITVCNIFPEVKIKFTEAFYNYDDDWGTTSDFYFKKINSYEMLLLNNPRDIFKIYNINNNDIKNIQINNIGISANASITSPYFGSFENDTSNLYFTGNSIYSIKDFQEYEVCKINNILDSLEIYVWQIYEFYWLPDSNIFLLFIDDNEFDDKYHHFLVIDKFGNLIKYKNDIQYTDKIGIKHILTISNVFRKEDVNPYVFYFKNPGDNHIIRINLLTDEVILYTNYYKELSAANYFYSYDNNYDVNTSNYFDYNYYSEYYGFDSIGNSRAVIYKINDKDNLIYLTTYIDENANNQKDAGEVFYSQPKYTIAHNNNSYEYQHTGNFGAIYTDTGTYTITPIFDKDLFTAIPSSSIVAHTTYDQSDTLIFALQPKAPVYDISVLMGNDFVTQPGFTGNYHATFTNNGNQRIDNLKIKAHIDSRLEIDSTSRAYTIDADTMIFSIGLLNIGETKRLFINFTAITPPNLNAGDTLINEVWASMAYTDIHLDDNYYLYKDAVLGSYDPNDKTVNREELEAANATAIAKTPLVYTIRFQNEGSYYAQAVRIYDTLPPNIDFSSFKTLAASHPFEVSIIQDSIVQITFKSINLYPKDWDESKSHGYITYSVLPNADADFSDGIHNKADIVLDYNLPIGTDFASTSVRYTTSTGIKNNIQALLKVYPNPANDILYFDKTITKATATIYSSEGRMMLQQNLNDNQIPIQNLPSGLYYLHLQVGEQSFYAAFVKE